MAVDRGVSFDARIILFASVHPGLVAVLSAYPV